MRRGEEGGDGASLCFVCVSVSLSPSGRTNGASRRTDRLTPGLDSVLADSCASATPPRPQTNSLSVSRSDGGGR